MSMTMNQQSAIKHWGWTTRKISCTNLVPFFLPPAREHFSNNLLRGLKVKAAKYLRTIFTHFWAGVSHVHVYACLRNAYRLTPHGQGA